MNRLGLSFRLRPKKEIPERNRIVVNLVSGRKYECGRTLPCQGAQLVELFGVVVDPQSVSAAKLFPARGTVAEPLFYFLVLVNALPE